MYEGFCQWLYRVDQAISEKRDRSNPHKRSNWNKDYFICHFEGIGQFYSYIDLFTQEQFNPKDYPDYEIIHNNSKLLVLDPNSFTFYFCKLKSLHAKPKRINICFGMETLFNFLGEKFIMKNIIIQPESCFSWELAGQLCRCGYSVNLGIVYFWCLISNLGYYLDLIVFRVYEIMTNVRV